MPPPSMPMPVARSLQQRFTDAGQHLQHWRGDWYAWTGAHWTSQEDALVKSMVYRDTERAFYVVKTVEGDDQRPWNPTSRTVNLAIDALAYGVLHRPATDEPAAGIAVANGVLDPATGELSAHTPGRFNLWSLPFGYDPAATCPAWITFLAEVVPDKDSRQLLCEWFGYVVSGRTDLQKILHLYGAKRSGKSTIARVLEGLVGKASTASVTLKSLTGAFGEQSLIGKSLAVVTDANWKVREVETAVEALKAISGEDSRDVNRKHLTAWHGKLGTRIVIIGNDEPEFKDASGALLGRLLHIQFRRSFFGEEDPTLTGRLLGELPGILNWSLSGLRSVTAAGRLLVPASSLEAERDIARTTSPVAGFIEDRCALMDPDCSVGEWLDDLHSAYRTWAGQQGQDHTMTRAVFAKSLRSAGNGKVLVKRHRRDGAQHQIVFGLMLTPAETPTLSEPTPARA